MKLLAFGVKATRTWLVLLAVSQVADDALWFESFTLVYVLALAVEVAVAVPLWLLDVLRFVVLSTAARGLAQIAVMFVVPAAGLGYLAGFVGGAHVDAAWPGFVLAAVSVLRPLAVLFRQFITRPKHAAACPIRVGDETLIALGDWGHRIGLAEPITQELRGVLGRTARVLGASGMVQALCEVPAGGRPLLAAGSNDSAVRLWDPVTGQRVHTLTGHRAAVIAMCTLEVGGTTLLVTGDADSALRVWDPVNGRRLAKIGYHPGPVLGLCQVPVGEMTLLASVSRDGMVRLWNPSTWSVVRGLNGSRSALHAVCTVETDERVLVAAAGQDTLVHVWDAETGEHLHALAGSGQPVHALCHVQFGDLDILAAAGDGPGVRLWNPATGEDLGFLGDEQTERASHMRTLCETRVGDTTVVIAAGYAPIAEVWTVDDDSIAEMLRESGSGNAT